MFRVARAAPGGGKLPSIKLYISSEVLVNIYNLQLTVFFAFSNRPPPQLRTHLDQVVDQAMDLVDAASDQMGKRFLSDRLPPALMEEEEERTAEGKTAAFEVGEQLGGWGG